MHIIKNITIFLLVTVIGIGLVCFPLASPKIINKP